MSFKKRRKEELPVNYAHETPPQELEVEEIVLGSILIDGNSINPFINNFSPNLFFLEKNRLIAEAIVSLYQNHHPIDILTVTQELKRIGTLTKAGGAYYVTTLTNKVTSSFTLDYHLRILQEEALRRQMIQICSASVRKAFDKDLDVFDTFQETQIGLENSLKSVISYEVKKVNDIHTEILLQSIEIANKGIKSGIPTGLRMLDNVTNGWQKSDLIILAGRPSMGKTAAAVSMVLYPSIIKRIPTAIFSLEMSNHQLVSRIQSNISGVNVSKLVKKQLTLDEINDVANLCKDLETAPIYIDDTPNISLLELKGKARKLVKENEVQLIIVDYLQLMRSGLNIGNREQEIAEISRGLKGLAKELNIPVIALSQLSRLVESRSDKKPLLSDLRESGQIEQDADMVIFCYRPEYYGIDNYEVGTETFESKGLFMFLIAKHRNGELGEIPLTFIHEQTKLTNHSFNNFDMPDKNNTFVQQSAIKPNTKAEEFINSQPDEDVPF